MAGLLVQSDLPVGRKDRSSFSGLQVCSHETRRIGRATGSSGNISMTWRIFGLEEIKNLVELANDVGFELETPMAIPAVKDRAVSWHGHNYTFISLVLKKHRNAD